MNLSLRGRTSNLSLLGCYVETPNALPLQTEVRVQIINDDDIFTALGIVTSCEPNTGIRIKFAHVELDQHEILRGWLAMLDSKRARALSGSLE